MPRREVIYKVKTEKTRIEPNITDEESLKIIFVRPSTSKHAWFVDENKMLKTKQTHEQKEIAWRILFEERKFMKQSLSRERSMSTFAIVDID